MVAQLQCDMLHQPLALVMKGSALHYYPVGLTLVLDSAVGRIYAVCTGLTEAKHTEFLACLRAALARVNCRKACTWCMAQAATAATAPGPATAVVDASAVATPKNASAPIAVEGLVAGNESSAVDSSLLLPPQLRPIPPHPLFILLPLVLLRLHCRQLNEVLDGYAGRLWDTME